MAAGILQRVSVHRGGRFAAGRAPEGWRQVDVVDEPLGDHTRVPTLGPLDDQRDLDHRIVHVVALENHMVETHVVAMVGSEDDQGVVVESLALEDVDHATDVVVDLADSRVVRGHHPPQLRLGELVVGEVATAVREITFGAVGCPAGQ